MLCGLAGVVKIVRDILQTVAQCHCRGVIVRDVKPDNFLFLNSEPNSPLRAIDFGLAEYCKRGETLTDKVRSMGVGFTLPAMFGELALS